MSQQESPQLDMGRLVVSKKNTTDGVAFISLFLFLGREAVRNSAESTCGDFLLRVNCPTAANANQPLIGNTEETFP